MELDKFINSVRSEVAKRFDLKTDAEIDAFFIAMEESAKDNQKALEKRDKMLRDTVTELCEAKRLLKAAVEDMRWINENTQDDDGSCVMRKCEGCGDCPLDINGDLWCKWKHEEAALKLIGATNDEP